MMMNGSLVEVGWQIKVRIAVNSSALDVTAKSINWRPQEEPDDEVKPMFIGNFMQ